ncbi:cell envelope integrity protein TolA [Rhodoferax aquaticus]|uniref:cell envelope integrity protein TolA n=1 Tax=Rhodoferax aquaticus TaxID=2527691 RepID=UPI001F27CD6A|nr:cell envelope integrity protein TolA [Rhodoferax aquaticus]
MALAIIAHGVLVAVLTIGVQWKRTLPPVTAQAELWASIPQTAAPAEPVEELTQPEPVKPVETPAPPVKQVADADIALAKEKARKEKEQERQQKLALEKQEQDKRAKELEAKEKLQKEKADKAAKDKKLEEQRAKDVKDAALAKDKEAKAKAEAKARDLEHQKTVQRMLQLANAASTSSDPNGSGSAAKSAGPSASYAGRIKAILRRNTTFTESLVGNPSTEAEVRTLSDGTIMSVKIIKSSGVKSWDDAVINAINKTETLPRDVDGRVPPVLIIIHTPKD